MLTQINISNFAIIKNLDLELASGMTVITGETGAGKSIVIDALDIALGDRADPQLIRHGADRCEINLSFDVSTIKLAKTWLNDHDLAADEDCIIRRTLSREGRSKSFINGRPVTLQQLRELTKHLVHIHSQHQHHALLQKDAQRNILDRLLNKPALLQKVRDAFAEWQLAKSSLDAHLATQVDDAKLALLQYQVQELNDLAPVDGEWETLTEQQQQLAHSESLQENLQACLVRLEDDNQHSIHSSLHDIEQRLQQVIQLLPNSENCMSLIQNASIQLTEAMDEIKLLQQQVECDPETLLQIDQRISALHTAARKHHINPEALVQHHQVLATKLSQFTDSEQITENLQQQVTLTWDGFSSLAQQLNKARQTAAKKIAKQITGSIHLLGMPQGEFAISVVFDENYPSAHGMDRIEFQVNTNPGQALMNMAKVASGGELSRISLAIQVIAAEQDDTPTLVFDEVDVGISGATAEIVGKLLQQLGNTSQILCITHLPQVAAQGQQHIKIGKKTSGKQTVSELKNLTRQERIDEIARMVGGVKITQQTLAHAEELLSEG